MTNRRRVPIRLRLPLWPGPGYHLSGLALLGLVGWLVTFDVARRTVRGQGLPRYVASGLLTGYGWLAVAGLPWAGGGTTMDGPRQPGTYPFLTHALADADRGARGAVQVTP